MKKTIYSSLVALMVLAFCNTKAGAQTISYYNFMGSCYSAGDSMLVNVSGALGTEILTTYYGDGTSTTGAPTFFNSGTDYFMYSHPYGASGTYTIKLVLSDASGNHIDSVTFYQTYTYCTVVQVTLYNDVNSDCMLSTGDMYFGSNPGYVEVDSAGTPVDTISTNYWGYYQELGPTGTIYTYKVITDPLGFAASCPATGIVYDTVGTGVTHYHTIGFTCSPSSTFDNRVSGFVSAGLLGAYNSYAINTTYCTPTSLTLNVDFSPKYSLVSVGDYYGNPLTYTVAGNHATVTMTGASASTPYYLAFNYTNATTLTIGDTVQTHAVLTPVTGDANTPNNYFSSVDTIHSSYDPNGKSVMPEGNVHAGTKLSYMITFENTGNAPAENIHVMDTLSDNLDVNSIQLTGSSAKVGMTLSTYNGHNIVKFDFPGIHLLDSTHHGQCDGFASFSIKAKTGLADGTRIDNKAGIYFDINPVVMTNNVENKIGSPVSVSTLTNVTKVDLYPNPVNNTLTINTNGNYSSVKITNTIGQVMLTQQMIGTEANVNVSALPAGIYFISLKGDSGAKVLQFEKL